MAVFIGAVKGKKSYRTYILTAFDTEIVRNFNTKKAMLNYLANELWAKKDMNSIAVVAMEVDSDGDLTWIPTKYSFDNR
jgi:hypothetical protein